jgi:hypothetical protein
MWHKTFVTNLSFEVVRSKNHGAASNITTDVARQFVIKSSFEIVTSVRRRQMWLNYLSLNEVRRNNKRTTATNIGCPTRYRTRHFFNNFTTNEGTGFQFLRQGPNAGLARRNTNVLLFKFRCNIFIGVRIIKEKPGSVAIGTHCIKNKCYSTIFHKIVVSLLDSFCCSSSFVNGNSNTIVDRARVNKSVTHISPTNNFIKFKDISLGKL